MPTLSIVCPKCGADIALDEAISHRLREQHEADHRRRLEASNAALAERERKFAAAEAALQAQGQALHAEIERRLESERDQLARKARQNAEAQLAAQLQSLKEQLAAQRERLTAAQKAEMEWLHQKAALESAREELQLQIARQLDAERRKIADEARARAIEAERLKLADKDSIIRGLQQQIDALQQRAEQGSQQLQGEALEFTLEADLRAAFPGDDLAEIKKGQRGADLAHTVRTHQGFVCGSILWEAKRARHWSADWPEKLKRDQREASADLAVLVTTSPPAGLRGLGPHEGIWVCEPLFAVALACALRQGLIATAAQRVQQANRADKAQALYEHLCSVEFRQHIEALAEAFIGLRQQLDAEQRAFARQWKEREQQLQKALHHTALLYGGIQGVAGREALPEIAPLALPHFA
jgi:hypothetical protein